MLMVKQSSTSEEAAYAARQRSLHNVRIIKYNHKNTEIHTYSTDTLLMPNSIKIATNTIMLLERHVSK